MTGKIRIAVQLQPIHTSYGRLREAVAQTEAMGADIIFNSDHFFPAAGDANGPCLEAWTMLGAWAEQTRRVEIGVSVSGNTYRNANLLADMARTVDNIAGGRTILGIGSGWLLKDHEEYGFAFPPQNERLENLMTTLQTIEDRLARLNPPPVRKIPIMIGNGGDRKPPSMVARYADIWLDFKDLATVAAYNAELDAACEAVGRDPRSIERGIAMASNDVCRVADFRKAGCTLFMVRLMGPDFDLAPVKDWIACRDSINSENGQQRSSEVSAPDDASHAAGTSE